MNLLQIIFFQILVVDVSIASKDISKFQILHMSNQRFYIPSLEETEHFTENLLSAATRRKTDGDVKIIQLFMMAKSEYLRSTGEDPSFWSKSLTDLSVEELVSVMKEFAIGARTEKGEPYEPVSLQSFWYSVKRHLKSSEIDFNSPIFKQVTDQFKCAFKKLRQDVGGQKPKTSNGLTAEEISYLFTSKCAGAHHPRALVNALIIYVMMMGRRGMTELQKMRYGDLFVTNSNGQLFLNMRDIYAKNRQGANPQDQLHRNGSLCAIKDKTKCPVHLFNIYSLKRPEKMLSPDTPLFLNANTKAGKDYRRDFTGNPFYISMRMGQNTLGSAVKDMVRLSGLSFDGRRITNTSIRKNLASTLAEGGMSSKVVMSYTRHKSAASLVHYDSINPAKATQATNLLLLSDACYDLPDVPPVLTTSPIPKIHDLPDCSSPTTVPQSSSAHKRSQSPSVSQADKSKRIKTSPGSSLKPKNKQWLKNSGKNLKSSLSPQILRGIGTIVHEPSLRPSLRPKPFLKSYKQQVRIVDTALLASIERASFNCKNSQRTGAKPNGKDSAAHKAAVQAQSVTIPPASNPKSPALSPKTPARNPKAKSPRGIPKSSRRSPKSPTGSPKSSRGSPKSPTGTPKSPVSTKKSPISCRRSPNASPKTPSQSPKSPAAKSYPNTSSATSARPPPYSPPRNNCSQHYSPGHVMSPVPTSIMTPLLSPQQIKTPQQSQIFNVIAGADTGSMTFNGPVTINYHGSVTINKYCKSEKN